MEGRGNMVTVREVTKEWDSPVEQGDTKGEVQEERSKMGKQVSINWSLGRKEQKRSMGVVLWR